jgi:dipeptidyl aminopeptidase/acylaminoacyl peptidase
MKILKSTALLVAVPVLLGASASADSIRYGATSQAASTLATLDTDKAQPSRLAWSPDGKELYVQTFEGDFLELNTGKGKKIEHYVFSTADGSKKKAEAEPAWAREYWAMKSHKNAPDLPALVIDIKEEQRQQKTTSVPMGGDLARGGAGGDPASGTSAGDVAAARAATQIVTVRTLTLKGEIVGQFENATFVPGLTFGWGPAGSKSIVFAAPKTGRVVLMDDSGAKREITGSKDAVLPAWSPDGSRVAWLQKEGRKKYVLQVSSVQR